MDIQLEHVMKRLAVQNLSLDLDAAARRHLAKKGYDPQFGARPLKRAIQEELLDPLAMKILDGEFRSGETIVATAADDELIFTKK